ncbi:MAG: hypothetical protein ACRDBM_06800, partial [Sporomusa sp.]
VMRWSRAVQTRFKRRNVARETKKSGLQNIEGLPTGNLSLFTAGVNLKISVEDDEEGRRTRRSTLVRCVLRCYKGYGPRRPFDNASQYEWANLAVCRLPLFGLAASLAYIPAWLV